MSNVSGLTLGLMGLDLVNLQGEFGFTSVLHSIDLMLSTLYSTVNFGYRAGAEGCKEGYQTARTRSALGSRRFASFERRRQRIFA
jgi:hypothetical protein